MRAFKRACGLLSAVFLLGLGSTALADSRVPQLPGTYAVGDAALAPGMVLRVLRGATPTEVARMRVIGIRGDEVQLELLSGTAQMLSGDTVQVASAPISPR